MTGKPPTGQSVLQISHSTRHTDYVDINIHMMQPSVCFHPGVLQLSYSVNHKGPVALFFYPDGRIWPKKTVMDINILQGSNYNQYD